MMDYESTQSLEKLVIDNDICGMAVRLIRGIAQRDEPIAADLLNELASDGDFMTHPHTLQWHLLEQKYSRVINRDGYDQWVHSGKLTLAERASGRVRELLGDETVSTLSLDKKEELRKIMGTHSRSLGFEMSTLLYDI